MWRFLMICMLAVFVPMGHGLAEERVNPEEAFFDAIVNDDGELVEITTEFYRETLVPLLANVYKERFGCVETAYDADYRDLPEEDYYYGPYGYSLFDHFDATIDYYSLRVPSIKENRYIVFRGCAGYSCRTIGLHIIDTIKQDFAVAMIEWGLFWESKVTNDSMDEQSYSYTTDNSKYVNARPVKLFLSHRVLETFKYKAAILTVDWINNNSYDDYKREIKPSERYLKPLEFVYVDCRKNRFW